MILTPLLITIMDFVLDNDPPSSVNTSNCLRSIVKVLRENTNQLVMNELSRRTVKGTLSKIHTFKTRQVYNQSLDDSVHMREQRVKNLNE